MDVGIFMASGTRLRIWLILPPVLIVSIGLGSHAWQQRAVWKLEETKAISNVLPSFITARGEVLDLVESFKTDGGKDLVSQAQMGSFLQEMAEQNNFTGTSVSTPDQKNQPQKAVPVQNYMVKGSARFMDIQLFINKAKSEQRLISVSSIKIAQPSEGSAGEQFEVEILFELLLLDGMKAFDGGTQ